VARHPLTGMTQTAVVRIRSADCGSAGPGRVAPGRTILRSSRLLSGSSSIEPFIAVAPAASQPAAADRAGTGAAVRAVAVTAMQAGCIFRPAELPPLLHFAEIARIRRHVAHGNLQMLAGSSIQGRVQPGTWRGLRLHSMCTCLLYSVTRSPYSPQIRTIPRCTLRIWTLRPGLRSADESGKSRSFAGS
jgi:hypothetical protein